MKAHEDLADELYETVSKVSDRTIDVTFSADDPRRVHPAFPRKDLGTALDLLVVQGKILPAGEARPTLNRAGEWERSYRVV